MALAIKHDRDADKTYGDDWAYEAERVMQAVTLDIITADEARNILFEEVNE